MYLKVNTVDPQLNFSDKKNKNPIKIMRRVIYDRSSTIPSCFVGHLVSVHKGTKNRRLLIHKYNVGYKFGEFGFTRKPFFFPFRKKKGRKFRR